MQESTELRELINGCFLALANVDAEFFERHVLCGAELRLISAPSEEWFGGVEGFDLLRDQAASGRGALQPQQSRSRRTRAVTSAGVLR